MDAGAASPSIWDIGIPIISVVVVGVGIFVSNSAKFYTIREQEAFRDTLIIALENIRKEHRAFDQDIHLELHQAIAGISKQIDDAQHTTKYLVADVRDRIKVLEQTRPTTGELQAALKSGYLQPRPPE